MLRVYPVEGASPEECADALVRAEREAGTDHAFVDLQCLAESVDHALEVAGRILDHARRH